MSKPHAAFCSYETNLLRIVVKIGNSAEYICTAVILLMCLTLSCTNIKESQHSSVIRYCNDVKLHLSSD